jgi:hypothetical protein
MLFSYYSPHLKCKQKFTIYTNYRYNLTVNVVKFSLLLYDPNIFFFSYLLKIDYGLVFNANFNSIVLTNICQSLMLLPAICKSENGVAN